MPWAILGGSLPEQITMAAWLGFHPLGWSFICLGGQIWPWALKAGFVFLGGVRWLSFSLKAGRAFLEEGPDAFLIVRAVVDLASHSLDPLKGFGPQIVRD